MLELGQPNHPYDLAKVPGGRPRHPPCRRRRDDGHPRRASSAGSPPTTSSSSTATTAPSASPGSWAAQTTEIDDSTTDLLVEMAWFQPIAVSKTARRLGLRTEASARFEKGVDPDGIERRRRAASSSCSASRHRRAPPTSRRAARSLAAGPAAHRPGQSAARHRALAPTTCAAELEPIGFACSRRRPGWSTTITTCRSRRGGPTAPSRSTSSRRSPGTGATTASALPCRRRAHFGHLTERQHDAPAGPRRRSWASGCPRRCRWRSSPRATRPVPGSATTASPSPTRSWPRSRCCAPRCCPACSRRSPTTVAHRQRGVDALRDRPRVPASRPDATPSCPTSASTWRWPLAGRRGARCRRAVVGAGRAPGPRRRAARRAGPRAAPDARAPRSWSAGEVVGAVGEVDPGVLEAYGIDERVAWFEVDLGRLLDLPAAERPFQAVQPDAVERRRPRLRGARRRSPAADVLAAIAGAGGELLVVGPACSTCTAAPASPRAAAASPTALRFQAPDRTLTDRRGRRGPCSASSTPSSRPSRRACVADHPSRLRLGFARRIEPGRSPLPEGTLAVGVGLLVSGITAYGFLVLAARALGPEPYAPLGLLWTAVFLRRPRVLPAGRAGGQPGPRRAPGPAARAAARCSRGPALLAAGLLGRPAGRSLVAAGRHAARHLFDDQGCSCSSGSALGLAGTAAGHLARGACSGQGRFRPYAVFLGADGVIRLVLCVGPGRRRRRHALAGTASPSAWRRSSPSSSPWPGARAWSPTGPTAGWGEVSRALLALLVGSILSFTLVNGGPLAIELLGSEARAGRRRPLPQRADHRPGAAVPVPGRAGVAAAEALRRSPAPAASTSSAPASQPARRHRRHRRPGHRRRLRPRAPVVRLLFGEDFELDHRTARPARPGVRRSTWSPSALAQAVIALGGHRAGGRLVGGRRGWRSCSPPAFAADDLFLRVELGPRRRLGGRRRGHGGVARRPPARRRPARARLAHRSPPRPPPGALSPSFWV